ncbi:MAG: LemA family protein [Bacteroidetes bacterium]|nr:MAG: LemA family protein [Bacteroidota bacterium]
MRVLWIFLILALVVGGCSYFTGKSTYNQMVVLQEQVASQTGQLQNVYQRRADLIPNIVETVKGYANFEQNTLTQVANARAQVGSFQLTPETLKDPEAMAQFDAKQGQLMQAMKSMLSVAENYPDLKANSNFQALIVELEGSENRISTERKKYNDVAKEYNTHIKQFPTNIFANMFGFKEISYFQAQAGSEQAPKVNFGN